MRVHIGNISPKLAETPDKLEKRLANYGTLQLPLDLRCKPLADHYYAFVDIDVTPQQWTKLRQAFNGVVFMGKKMLMAEAKPGFKPVPATDGLKEAKQRQVKAAIINHNRVQRIEEATTPVPQPIKSLLVGVAPSLTAYGYHMSPHTINNASGSTKNAPPSKTLVGFKSYGAWSLSRAPFHQQYSRTGGNSEVVLGRLRKTARNPRALREQTLRILINGELKTFKCFKTKLWGVERRAITDLAHVYERGEWKLGDGHVIERVTRQPVVVGEIEAEPKSTEAIAEETNDSKQILAKFLGAFDFDKPVEVDDDNGIDAEDITYDSKGRRRVQHFDYEMAGEGVSLLVAEGDIELGMKIINEAKSLAEPVAQPQYFSEEDDDLDFALLKPQTVEDGDNIEVVPETATTSEPQLVETQPTAQSNTNDTESLRTLLNSGPSSGFSLALGADDDDLDEEAPAPAVSEELIKQIKEKQDEVLMEVAPKAKHGLFWSHADSAFMASQSQYAQIGSLGTKQPLPGDGDYEAWFYAQRSEVTAECKRRRRQVQRAFKRRKVQVRT